MVDAKELAEVHWRGLLEVFVHARMESSHCGAFWGSFFKQVALF